MGKVIRKGIQSFVWTAEPIKSGAAARYEPKLCYQRPGKCNAGDRRAEGPKALLFYCCFRIPVEDISFDSEEKLPRHFYHLQVFFDYNQNGF